MEKIKQIITNSLDSDTGKDILTVLIVILVGLGSFGLGRLSKVEPKKGLKIAYNGQEIGNTVNSPNFQTGEEAEQAGYTLSASCI